MIRRLARLCPLLALLALGLLIPQTFAAGPAETQAIAAAEAWLKLADGGDAAGTWREAAGFFKAAMPAEAWSKALRAARAPLGKVKSRKLRSATYARTLPGAPDGEYVVILYDTQFEHKNEAVETITPALDK